MPPLPLLAALALLNPESLAEQVRRSGGSDVAVEMVQLDADAAMEAIVRYTGAETGAHAVVLDRAPAGWVEAGRFNTWWGFTSGDAARLLTLRPTVETGIADLIVRTRGGGTENEHTLFRIFRLREHRVVLVFEVREQDVSMEHPSGNVKTTVARVEFPSPGVLHQFSSSDSDTTSRCTEFRWNPASYRFEAVEGCGAPPQARIAASSKVSAVGAIRNGRIR